MEDKMGKGGGDGRKCRGEEVMARKRRGGGRKWEGGRRKTLKCQLFEPSSTNLVYIDMHSGKHDEVRVREEPTMVVDRYPCSICVTVTLCFDWIKIEEYNCTRCSIAMMSCDFQLNVM